MTQGLRKLLPTLKSSRRIGARLADGMENAFWSNFITVALPPERASPDSGCSKRGVSSLPQAAKHGQQREEAAKRRAHRGYLRALD